MINQHISKNAFISHPSLQKENMGNDHQDYGQANEKNEVIKQKAPLHWVIDFTHKAISTIYQIFQGSISKLVTTNQGGQQVLVDIISPEGSFFPRYNFLGTPQVLHILPVNSNQKSAVPLPFTVSVKPLEENCFELVIEGNKKSKEELGIHIYDESKILVYSEQITCKGHFKRLYDLKWPQLTDVSFEVTSRYGIQKAGII